MKRELARWSRPAESKRDLVIGRARYLACEDNLDWPWVRNYLGKHHGLMLPNGEPVNKTSERLLAEAEKVFQGTRTDRLEGYRLAEL